ncbi:MAG: radical SAM protein [Candidatus Omnitrophota bacterium]
MPKLKEVIISITNRCNFKCRMCDIPNNKIGELSTASWKQVIKDAVLYGARSIIFSGGEPLLREDICELISFTKNNSLGACLTSNGYLINQEAAYKLYQSGIDVVNISIEGPKHIHDYLRGKGMYERALLALENLRKEKIESTIATMVSRYNYKYLPDIVELARQYGVTTIKFQPFSKIFLNNQRDENGFLISEKEIKKLTLIIKEVMRISNEYAIAVNPAGYLEMIPFYLGRQYTGPNNGCAALESSCPINCNGDIYPCWVIAGQDALIGNIKENSFLDIWDSKRHRRVIEKIKKEGCPGCMMSCYDENFGKESIERRIVMRARQLQKNGIGAVTRSFLKRWIKRLKFYGSYRGSFKETIRRVRGLFRKEKLSQAGISTEEIDKVSREIDAVRGMFEKEMKCAIKR